MGEPAVNSTALPFVLTLVHYRYNDFLARNSRLSVQTGEAKGYLPLPPAIRRLETEVLNEAMTSQDFTRVHTMEMEDGGKERRTAVL